jgi:hypothetical protein
LRRALNLLLVAGIFAGAAASAAHAPAPRAGPRTAIRSQAVRPAFVAAGATVLLLPRSRTSGCRLGPLPDRSCSPGAFYSKLTKKVICSRSFRTGDYRNVPAAEKHAVEVEYGLAPRSYGSSLEIDHVVSLELGGSNDIANLFPEQADAAPGYHVKDKLENRLHELVCAGRLSLRSVRRRIASDWASLYRGVFGAAPAP